MDRGWVKLWRKTLDNGILRNPNLCTFWIWCLLKASHKEKTLYVGNQQVTLNKGEFVFGRRQAATELNLSERNIRTCLNSLKSTSNLTIKTTNKFSIISIVNWDAYQQKETQTDQQNDQQPDQVPTSNRPATDQQPTTNKNGNNVKNENIVVSENGYLKKNAARIITYLNKKTGKNFKDSTDKTIRLIKARLAENFKLEDFKSVIDNQTAKWLSDPKMVDYLRPETLFGTKFESYLQTKPAETEVHQKIGVPDYAD